MSPTDLLGLPQILHPAGNWKHHILSPKVPKQDPQQAVITSKQTKGSGTAPRTLQTPSHPNLPHSTSVGAHLLSSTQGLSWKGEAFSFSRSSQPNKLQMIFKPLRCCSGIKFKLAESQSRGGIASLEPPPSALNCHFQVVHVKKPEGAQPPAWGPEGSHTHQGVFLHENCPKLALCADGGCAQRWKVGSGEVGEKLGTRGQEN